MLIPISCCWIFNIKLIEGTLQALVCENPTFEDVVSFQEKFFEKKIKFLLCRKISVCLFVALVSSAAAQESITLNCQFLTTVFGEYTCRLLGIEVLDPAQEVIVGGEHVEGQTNDDVQVVQIRNSNTPFVIPQLFAAFPNVLELDIQNSNLQVLSIPAGIQLEYLTLYRNNISRIENGTFIGQSGLEFIEAMDNRIEVIEEDAFLGLEGLLGLMLIGNRIRALAPRTFHPLENLIFIDLERNLIERIEDGTFAENPELLSIYLEFNQINAVSPTFTAGFGINMEYVNLQGNRCINRPFALRDPIDLILLNNALNPCFNNFIGETPQTRRITLEFQGPLSLFDEFGNIIARVN